MAKKDDDLVNREQAPDVAALKRRLDMLHLRLANIESMLTVVAERVLKQSITLNMTCPNCGRIVEIALIGTEKPRPGAAR